MVEDVFSRLALDVTTKINSRKILEGITEVLGAAGKEQTFYVAIDKLDKIGKVKVLEELALAGFADSTLEKVSEILDIRGSNEEMITHLEELLQTSEIGMEGIRDVRDILQFSSAMGSENLKVQYDITLARGLSYYTGAIFEVKADHVTMGSIGGGGRYDDLTGVFGLQGVSGVGFSFGIDRIFDVMNEMSLFPESSASITKVLVASFDPGSQKHGLDLVNRLRQENISSEIYPDPVKMKKQLNYANKKGIPFVVLIGENEIEKGVYTLKNMTTGEQAEVDLPTLFQTVK